MAEPASVLDYREPEWVAKKLGLDKNTDYKYLQEGWLPGVQLGRKWPAGLVERLIDQVEGRAGALPLMQFALQQLWPKHSLGRWDDAKSTQLIEDFLTEPAEDLYDGVAAEDHQIIRRAFLTMVQFGEGTADTRRVARLSEFVAAKEDRQHVRELLEPY